MPLVNTPKVTSALVNAIKVNIGETWATITTIWASETRTWAATVSFMDNTARTTSSVTNIAKP